MSNYKAYTATGMLTRRLRDQASQRHGVARGHIHARQHARRDVRLFRHRKPDLAHAARGGFPCRGPCCLRQRPGVCDLASCRRHSASRAMPATAAHPIGANTDPRPHALVLLGAALTGTGAKSNMVPGGPPSKPADAVIAACSPRYSMDRRPNRPMASNL